ncbi:MAG: NAD-dependent epimerase/dehydratase family protein [Candidatus Sabulitectum sp.]|nr:NAD-dependent epimerase/dehydratase family protein [Candidatus Sabulitectum sp.]
MKILITGGAGFIGSNIADTLKEAGHDVHVLDDLSTGFRENVGENITLHELDIRTPEAAELIENGGYDILCHHAAQMDVRRSVREPRFDADVNIKGTLNILEAAVKGRVKRVVYASTGGAVYGEPRYIPVREDHPINPICHYGISKHTVEHYLFLYRYLYDLGYVVLRYPNVYGPRQNPFGEAGVTAIFTVKYLNGDAPVINGDGQQLRDYVHVKDIARANLAAMDLSRSEIEGEIFNIGWGVGNSVEELDRIIRGYTDTDLKPSYGPALPEEIQKVALDPSKANSFLGWKAEIQFENGLKDLVEYHRNKLSQ